MKKTGIISLFLVCVLFLLIAFSCSIAFADFYSVASGKKSRKTILVSPKSTEIESGTALRNTIDNITDAGETNPYLVVIEPGVYNIGDTLSLEMKEWVDIQGSGENVTKITGAINSFTWGVLMGANNMEIRFLTIENTGGSEYQFQYSCCIGNQQASPKITNVTVTSTGKVWSRRIGIYNSGSSPIIKNVTVTVTGNTNECIGIRNDFFSEPVMTNVTAIASGGNSINYGFFNWSSCTGSVYMKNSLISGGTAFYTDSGETAYIVNTQLDGGTGGPGKRKCIRVYDGDFTFYSNTCP